MADGLVPQCVMSFCFTVRMDMCMSSRICMNFALRLLCVISSSTVLSPLF